MVVIGDYEVRERMYYSKEHEWMKVENEMCRVGITDYAQKTLHEVVYVDLPPLGRNVTQNASFGTVESVKAVSEIYSPISGDIVERNENLVNSPELVNEDPYGSGWIVVVKSSRLNDELKNLLSHEDYAKFIEELIKKK
ncbi:MAG TPA: glycine cleavage system protein GcvH [Candidatus Bathyarchaeia archaeon]|nr:glycine cleavage system protein GcvH [Candidatus Bathyarchaeia archaeon]